MKFKQFKKEINQDSDLLKLSGKDLAVIFEIDVLKAKYFKKRYKEELQCAVEFDINDTHWFDTLVNQNSEKLSWLDNAELQVKENFKKQEQDWISSLMSGFKKLPQVNQSMSDFSKSDTYNEDWFKAINYGTDNLKLNKLNGKDFDGDISNINNNFNLSSEELEKKHKDDIIKKCNSEEEANYYLNMYDYFSKEHGKIEVDFSDLKRVFNEIENKHFKKTKLESKVGDSKTTVNSKTVGLLDFKTSKDKLNNLSDNNLLQVGDSFKDINTGKKCTKSKYGTILETNCTCPVCHKKVLLETFNSGKNLVECPECNILLQVEDNVVERFTDELPKSNVTVDSLMGEINKIADEYVLNQNFYPVDIIETYTFIGTLKENNIKNQVIYMGNKIYGDCETIQINFSDFTKFFRDLDLTQFQSCSFSMNNNLTISDRKNSDWVTAIEQDNKKVLSVIRAIRNSFIGSEIVYTKGSCYQFYLILREVFPQAEAFYDEDHLITKIENKYYDITGEVSKGRCLSFIPTPNDTWINQPYNIFKLNK